MTDGSLDVPIQTSLLTSGWNVDEAGDDAYKLVYTSTGASTSPGTIILDKTVVTDADLWKEYSVNVYMNQVSIPDDDTRMGFVMRYQDIDNYYFVGFCTDTTNGDGTWSTYEVWIKEAGAYSRKANSYDTGNNNEGSSIYALPDEVGTTGVLGQDIDYHVRAEIYGTSCKLFIQNVQVYENLTDFTEFTEGELGLEVFTQSNTDVIGMFDNVRGAT